MVANKTHGEKTRWELHKNALSYFKQILKATPNKITATYHCTDIGNSLENLLGAMNDRDKWREIVKEIYAVSADDNNII